MVMRVLKGLGPIAVIIIGMLSVIASGGGGGVDESTQPKDTQWPSIPLGVVSTPISLNQINLSWENSFDSEGNLTDYKIYKNDEYLKTTSSTFILINYWWHLSTPLTF